MNSGAVLSTLERSFTGLIDELRKAIGSEWVDQHSSPLGKRMHLDACRRGDLVARHVGNLRLVRRAEIDAYIEKHRVQVRREVSPDETEAEARARRVQELMTAEPKRRRRSSKGGTCP